MTTNASLLQRLETLKNYHTRYEVIATNGAQRILAGYTSRKGRMGILKILRLHGEAWQRFAGSDNLTFGKRVADGAKLGNWQINFSGRTQREAYIAGELPFITTVASVPAAA